MSCDSVMLVGYGGPARREEVRPFLEHVLSGMRVAPGRIDEVEHHYAAVGGYSPFVERTLAQGKALEAVMGLPVYLGTRNWHPFVHDTVAEMARHGRRRSVAVIMAPHQSATSWDRYQADVAEARDRFGQGAPEFAFTRPFYDHPGYLDAVVDRVREALSGEDGLVLFTAHSIPVAMAEQGPYVEQLEVSCRGVAERLGGLPWRLVYQSRSGDPRSPWLEPDVCDSLDSMRREGVESVVAEPIGFLCDHVEVLFDLDVEARQKAEQLGMKFVRARTVEDHPRFIEALADRVREAAG